MLIDPCLPLQINNQPIARRLGLKTRPSVAVRRIELCIQKPGLQPPYCFTTTASIIHYLRQEGHESDHRGKDPAACAGLKLLEALNRNKLGHNRAEAIHPLGYVYSLCCSTLDGTRWTHDRGEAFQVYCLVSHMITT